MKLRGYLTVVVVGAGLTLCDLVQRTAIAGLARMLPARRIAILSRWERMLAYFVIGSSRWIGGARISVPPTIPGQAGVLVLMNHQSLLDIPLVVATLRPHHPCIVTRASYARGKPLISHMVRLYQYPVVEPGATGRRSLQRITEAARHSPVPFVLFPEGTRTCDGEIGTWKVGGLRRVLRVRRWTVYLLVADGYWRTARLSDFLHFVSAIEGKSVVVGPFEGPEPGTDPDVFIEEMRERMRIALAGLRSSA